MRPVAAAVALTARTHPRGQLRFVLQVKDGAVYLQSSHAAQEAPLTTGRTFTDHKGELSKIREGHQLLLINYVM